MGNILIITPINSLKKRLRQLIGRRFIAFDYLKIFDSKHFNSISLDEKEKYLNYVIKKRKIDFVVWLPSCSESQDIRCQDLMSYCMRDAAVRCIVFNIENFISIEKDKSIVFMNKILKNDELLTNDCGDKVNIEYLMDIGLTSFENDANSKYGDSPNYDDQISVSLIDDIAEYILSSETNLKVSSQSYTLAEINQKIETAFISLDCGKKEGKFNLDIDRLEILFRQKACCLQPIYQLKANDFWHTKRVESIRSEMGAKLAKHLSASSIEVIDIVVPVPESGKYYAQGLARELGKPFIEAIIRNENIGRGLQIEDAAQRNIFIRNKLTVIEELVKNKNIGIVDEAVFTGATLRIVVDLLKDAGAKRIHLLLPTPHNLRACEYNVLPQRNVLLDYVRRNDLKDYFDVDEITFSNIDDLNKSLGNRVCIDCFDCLS